MKSSLGPLRRRRNRREKSFFRAAPDPGRDAALPAPSAVQKFETHPLHEAKRGKGVLSPGTWGRPEPLTRGPRP